MTLAIIGTRKSQYVIIWVKSHPAPHFPSPFLLGDANPLSTFFGTSATALESLITLAITGIEKSLYDMTWVKSHPALPLLLGDANPLSTFFGTSTSA